MRKILPLVMILCLASFVVAQNSFVPTQKKSLAVVSVAFYNLENLFDTIDNPGVNDVEYTPNGGNRWNGFKYKNKLQKMSVALSQLALEYCPKGPAFVGVSEIENRGVLEDLVAMPELKDRNWDIVHYDSPDRRGVDVGLLYNPDLFEVTSSHSYPLILPEDTAFLTRDILLVDGLLLNEKVSVLVGHWPSRIGGEKRSSPKREAVAALCKHIADSILAVAPQTKVFIMGDLNDDPSNRSCAVVLNAKKNIADVDAGGLYNPFWKILDKGIGSLAYQGSWNLFDQIIISSELLGSDRSSLKYWKAEVFNRDFLKQQDGKYKGYPLRTHAGGVYLNGYSDHFPTIVYLIKEQ